MLYNVQKMVNATQLQPYPTSTSINRKLVARKTAGTRSYVELITDVIMNSPEKRLTANEIYECLICNVNLDHSPASLKNTIRHTLSWYKKFKRVQRGTLQKPSWWTVVNEKDIVSYYRVQQPAPDELEMHQEAVAAAAVNCGYHRTPLSSLSRQAPREQAAPPHQQQPNSAPVLLNYNPEWFNSRRGRPAVSAAAAAAETLSVAASPNALYKLPQHISCPQYNARAAAVSPYVYHTKFSCLPHYRQQIGAATAVATTINCRYEQMNVNRMEQLQQQHQPPHLTPRPVATMPAPTLHNAAAVYGNATPAAAFRSQYKQTVASLMANNVAAAAAAAYGLTTAQPPASNANNMAAAALVDPGSFLRDKSAVGPVSKSRANASPAATYYLTCGDNKIANGLAYPNYHTTDAGSLINRENHTIESNVGDPSSWLLCQLT